MIRRLAALATLALLAVPAIDLAGQQLTLVTADGVTLVESSGPRGYPAYPLTLLGRLGGRTSLYGSTIIVRLYGDTLYFRAGYPDFRVNRESVPLRSWTFETAGTLYVPGHFFTEWLPARYPRRLQYANGTLTAGRPNRESVSTATPSPPPARQDTVRMRAPVPTRPARSADGEAGGAGNGALIGFIDARISGVYASNIDDRPVPRSAIGSVGRLAVGIRSAQSRPFLTVRYDLGMQRFPDSDRWNRTTHDASVLLAPNLGMIRPRAEVAGRLGSLTEDREFADQFQLGAGLEIYFTRTLRLLLQGEQRIQRITGTVERSDTTRQLGVALTRRWGSGGSVTLDGRYLDRRSEQETSRYTGWSGRARLQLPLTEAARLTLRVEHRRREYPERLLELSGEDAPRSDRRWTPSVGLSHDFAGAFAVELEYEFEENWSNDLEAAYRGHRVGLTLRRRW